MDEPPAPDEPPPPEAEDPDPLLVVPLSEPPFVSEPPAPLDDVELPVFSLGFAALRSPSLPYCSLLSFSSFPSPFLEGELPALLGDLLASGLALALF
ncbi:hypothetical protein ACFVY1_45605 [Streptomyces sp. NPDC058293]|uniref:hypothetical protein n=1 Tax=Streptomyces sp. NPDC058293 TaxID=3346429 RepID=UPI0036E334A0